MKSVLFIMNYSVENKSRRKYNDQMNAVRRLGYDVWHIGHDENTVYLCHGTEKTVIGRIIRAPIAALAENLIYISIYRAVRRALEIKSDFTYCYIRRFFFERSLKTALKRLKKKGTKTVIEIPTYPHRREQSSARLVSRLLLAFNNYYENASAKYIDLFCPMGEHADTILGVDALNIENGIDVSDIRLRSPHFVDGEYHIIALAVMTFWHGYDRLISSLADYYERGGSDKVYLHLVGAGTILATWRELASSLGVSEYVLFEGVMNNEQMNEAFDGYDLGAASLGRYRCGLSVVYELKTREYMARGLPFIYAVDDFVVDSYGKYCVKVSNSDEPIDMNRLVEFMRQMREQPSAPAQMREFAKEHMTFDEQFKKIFDRLEKTDK